MSAQKIYETAAAAVAACLIWLVNNTPAVARVQIYACLLLLIVDTASGVAVAKCGERIKSNSMRTGMIAKTCQYVLFTCMMGAPAMVLQNWLPVECALLAVVAFEMTSIFENLVRLEAFGGVPIQQLRPMMEWGKKFFDIGVIERRVKASDLKETDEILVVVAEDERRSKTTLM